MKTLKEFLLETNDNSLELLLKRSSNIHQIIELFNKICENNNLKKIKKNFYTKNNIEIGLIEKSDWRENSILVSVVNKEEKEITHGSYLIKLLKDNGFIPQRVLESKTENELIGKNLDFELKLTDDEFNDFYENYLEKYKVISLTSDFEETGKFKYQIYYKGEDLGSGIIYAVWDIDKNILKTSINENIDENFDETEEGHDNRMNQANSLIKSIKTKIIDYNESVNFLKKYSKIFDDISIIDIKKVIDISTIDKLIETEKIKLHEYEPNLFMIM